MNFFETLIISSILGGTALIPFVDFVTKDIKSSKITFVIALVSSAIIAFVVDFLQGKIMLSHDPSTWFLTLSTVFITSQTVFNMYWKDSLLRTKFTSKISASTNTSVETISEAQPGEPAQPQDAAQG